MSFSLFLSSAAGAPGFAYANGVYTFNVNIRDMMPPERLRTKYKMRWAAISASTASYDDGASYHANIELKNAILDTQYNGSRQPYFPLFLVAGATAGQQRIVVRPDDNAPVIVQSLGEVYTINMSFFRNFVIVPAQVAIHFVLSFEPVE